ncbi:MAG: hypothetical protein H6767_01860 [Candidatus Peribacteria bacterium]|nr:MAG: hypothetical protein H6767_01860 [Candidatus Peribacteria bacterium]
MSWENLLSLTYTTEFMIFLTVLAIAWILYLFGYIIFILAIYRILSQITRDTTSSISASLVYGATHLSKSFATYWYIFAYVALIPALLFAL